MHPKTLNFFKEEIQTELLFGKPHADYFVDDKGITFTNFETLKKHLNI